MRLAKDDLRIKRPLFLLIKGELSYIIYDSKGPGGGGGQQSFMGWGSTPSLLNETLPCC